MGKRRFTQPGETGKNIRAIDQKESKDGHCCCFGRQSKVRQQNNLSALLIRARANHYNIKVRLDCTSQKQAAPNLTYSCLRGPDKSGALRATRCLIA
jgi:hypothetical protein